MEVRDHINYLKKRWPFIVLFGIIVGVIAFVVSNNQAPVYKTVQSYEIELVNRNATSDYQYGSYYDLKGVEIFTQHVMSLLTDPAVIQEIYLAAGLGVEIENLSRFTSQFRTDQGSAQHFSVTYTKYTETDAQAVADGMTEILTARVKTAQTDVTGNSMFVLRDTAPVIIYQESNIWLHTGVGALVGWLSALVLIYLRKYLSSTTT